MDKDPIRPVNHWYSLSALFNNVILGYLLFMTRLEEEEEEEEEDSTILLSSIYPSIQ